LLAAYEHHQKVHGCFQQPERSGPICTSSLSKRVFDERLEVCSIGFEGDEVLLDGLNPWQNEWYDLEEASIIVAHPSYPEQRHSMEISELRANGRTVKFAAGEFSNGVWGFYVQDPS